MMARLIRPTPQPDDDRPAVPPPPADLDPSVEWAARLVQPTRTVTVGSRQPVVVHVSSPEILDAQRVSVTVGDSTAAGTWVGEPGRHRDVMVMLGVGLPVPDGPGRVQVTVHGRSATPLLDAGTVFGVT